mgnify:CR=1 FL=1
MFTGIIQSVGTIRRLEPRGGDVRLGTASSRSFEIRNEGSAPLAVSATGLEGADAAVWSPDGRFLAFTSRRGEKRGDSTLHVLPIGVAGEVRTARVTVVR